ncbi:MAG: hypothetical protein A2190_04265 [Lysobacterales bacterium RIFOXYA1_FULL_69_10]|nr:MAG: hypothetical protein A2190_04265 [Xanthomonadales bacterium RIFOXYA1_FULL_69_10]
MMRLAWLLFFVLLASGLSPRVEAQQRGCTVQSASQFDFGHPGANPTSAVTTTADVRVRCEGNPPQRGDTVKVCVGVDPWFLGWLGPVRYMTRGSIFFGDFLQHQIYRDSASGPVAGLGNASAVGYLTLDQGPTNAPYGEALITLHGVIEPGQNGLPAGTYRESNIGLEVRSTTNLGESCGDAPVRAMDQTYAVAVLDGSCTVVAQDLAFGSHSQLSGAVPATTSIGVTCTRDTAYTVRMDGGTTANDVADRRMGLNGTGPAAQGVAYQLRHSGPNGPLWGDGTSGTSTLSGTGTGGSQTLPVYGRVLPQAVPLPGRYEDTVTVTVQY